MGKRLIRISNTAIISSKKDLIDHAANIVLNTGAVANGYIVEVTDSSVILKNKRSKKLHFSVDEINEIVLDK